MGAARQRRRAARSAAKLYNAGNAATRREQYRKAIDLYSQAIALDDHFMEAFYNRAIAQSKVGDEEACQRDLLEAMALGYNTDDFWVTFCRHINPALMMELLAGNGLPEGLLVRLRAGTEKYVQRGTIFLRSYPDYGLGFSQASLPARFMLVRSVGEAQDMHPVLFQQIFDICMEAGMFGDDEFAWRAKFLLATVLYEHYQTTEWSPHPSGSGVFFDDDYLMNRPHWGVPESLLQAAVSARMPTYEGEPVKHHLARFTLSLTREAIETLLRLRATDPPPPRSAWMNWNFAQFPFKILLATAAYLDDPGEVLRCVTLARRVNAAFAVTSWVVGRHQPGELFAAVAPSPDSVQAHVPPGTILTEYFIYETGGDNLVRASITPAGARISQRYVPPSEVSGLVGIGRQWQDPHLLAELRDDPDVSLRNLLLNTAVAMTKVPDESYGEWLNDVLFDPDVFTHAPDCHRLVVMPWNYLHNVPFHLLPDIRRRIDAGQIDEVVVSPSLALSLRLADRTPVARDTASCLFVGINSAEVDVGVEYAVVREAFRHTEALLDDSATLARVLAACVRFDVIHFACHGGFDLSQNTGYLLLANDERLYPADLALAPGLGADLMVLNACISGVSSREGRNGDQSLGLPSALLYGGARQVIGTLWPVDTEAAVNFAATFYPDWRSSADSTASIVLRTQTQMRERFTDMFSWGAHAVFGDWR